MNNLFKPKNELWVTDKERLVERILYIVNNKPKDSPSGYVEDKIYYLLENYGVYFKPIKNKKSKIRYRLTAPLYYIIGIILFIILRPITYLFNISMVNTKIGYFMRKWESLL